MLYYGRHLLRHRNPTLAFTKRLFEKHSSYSVQVIIKAVERKARLAGNGVRPCFWAARIHRMLAARLALWSALQEY